MQTVLLSILEVKKSEQIDSFHGKGHEKLSPKNDRPIVNSDSNTYDFFLPFRAVHDVLSKTIVLELPHGDNLRGPAFNVEAAAAR